MPFEFFKIYKEDVANEKEALNCFMRSHNVLNVDKQFVVDGDRSYWFFCIEYFVGAIGGTDSTFGKKKPRMDYKELLRPEEFSLYTRLRDIRKELADAEAVPVYTIFTNEQLAEMVRSKASSLTMIKNINGIGDAKVAKYGAKFLELINNETLRNVVSVHRNNHESYQSYSKYKTIVIARSKATRQSRPWNRDRLPHHLAMARNDKRVNFYEHYCEYLRNVNAADSGTEKPATSLD